MGARKRSAPAWSSAPISQKLAGQGSANACHDLEHKLGFVTITEGIGTCPDDDRLCCLTMGLAAGVMAGAPVQVTAQRGVRFETKARMNSLPVLTLKLSLTQSLAFSLTRSSRKSASSMSITLFTPG
jgi:hypothetical protein